MKHLYLTFLLLYSTLANGQGNAYLEQFKESNRSNSQTEQKIVANSNNLLEQAIPFTKDSIDRVRLKAYYLIFKKGMNSPPQHQSAYSNRLLDGCNDPESSIIGQNLTWLQSFPKRTFDKECKQKIDQLIQNRRLPHRTKAILLAGYVGTGQDILKQTLLQPDLPEKEKWITHLALARTGNEESISYCIKTANNIDLNNQSVEYLIPELIYTRQPQIINICIRHLYSDEKNCYLSDPDNEKSIICGYRIMELLAPVTDGFPYETDATGTLVADDYINALTVVREWFDKNPDYQIKNDSF